MLDCQAMGFCFEECRIFRCRRWHPDQEGLYCRDGSIIISPTQLPLANSYKAAREVYLVVNDRLDAQSLDISALGIQLSRMFLSPSHAISVSDIALKDITEDYDNISKRGGFGLPRWNFRSRL